MMVIFTTLRWLLRSAPAIPSKPNTSTSLNQVHPNDQSKKEEHHDKEISLSKDNAKVGEKNKPSPFKIDSPSGKHKTPIAHKRLSSFDDLNVQSSTQEIKSAECSKTLCPSPTSPTSPNQFDLEWSKSFDGKEQAPKPATGWQKFKDGLSELSKPSRAKQWAGRVLMVCVGAGSVYLILAISASSNSNSWPWGFWYVAALLFDQGVFQPLMTLAQYVLLYFYICKHLSERLKKLTHLVIGKDIMNVVDTKLKLVK